MTFLGDSSIERVASFVAKYTAFSVIELGMFEFLRMFFGISNAGKIMGRIFSPSIENKIFVYQEDLIIVADILKKIYGVLNVFETLKSARLIVNVDTCKFCLPSLISLGYVVDQNDLNANEEKVESILNYPKMQTVTQVKRDIGIRYVCVFH